MGGGQECWNKICMFIGNGIVKIDSSLFASWLHICPTLQILSSAAWKLVDMQLFPRVLLDSPDKQPHDKGKTLSFAANYFSSILMPIIHIPPVRKYVKNCLLCGKIGCDIQTWPYRVQISSPAARNNTTVWMLCALVLQEFLQGNACERPAALPEVEPA